MTVTLHPLTDDKTLVINLHGKLQSEDYELFVPQIEARIAEHGKINLVILLEDFAGWEASALWEDLKFDAKHFTDIERIAFVSDKRWHEGMALFCKPFTTAHVRSFEPDEEDEARRWAMEGN